LAEVSAIGNTAPIFATFLAIIFLKEKKNSNGKIIIFFYNSE